MQQPLISVIVPCYNQSIYMDECLQSVLDQTYQNWECIIVNDGSPDNTEEVAMKWVEKDSRFNYLYKENGGLSSARNAGIEIANGEWILPLDCDDKIGSQYLELATVQFDKDYTIIYCEAEFFGDKKGKWELPEFSTLELSKGNPIFCTAFYKKSSWQKVNGYDTNMIHGLEDWEFWLSIIHESGKVFKIDEVLFYYRIKNQSMITELNVDKKTKMLKYIEKKHIDFFHNHLGSMHFLQESNINLSQNFDRLNIRFSEFTSSKRYKLMDKIFSFLGR